MPLLLMIATTSDFGSPGGPVKAIILILDFQVIWFLGCFSVEILKTNVTKWQKLTASLFSQSLL